MLNILKELFIYIQQRKKYLLLPIIIILFLFGAIFVTTQGTVIAPFMYTVF